MNLIVKALAILLIGLFSINVSGSNTMYSELPQDDLPKYGHDSVTCVQNLSLYRESFKQWKQSKYKSPAINHAYKFWKLTFKDCPKASENIYVDGAKMFDYFIKNAKDDSVLLRIKQGRAIIFVVLKLPKE